MKIINGFSFKQTDGCEIFARPSFSRTNALYSVYDTDTLCFYIFNIPIWSEKVTNDTYLPIANKLLKRYTRLCRKHGLTHEPETYTRKFLEVKTTTKEMILENKLALAKRQLDVAFQMHKENASFGIGRRVMLACRELDEFERFKKLWKHDLQNNSRP
jgi:hypothetical protein